MKSLFLSVMATSVITGGCGVDDATDDAPDAAALDAAALDAAAPDAEPGDCMAAFRPAVVDSVEVGSIPAGGTIDDLVPWQDNDVVQLVVGGQGLTMLVAEVVVRGSNLPAAYRPLDEYLPFDLEIFLERYSDVEWVTRRNAFGDPVFAAEDGTWYHESVYLPFELDLPVDGEAIDMVLKLACFEIRRTLIADLPEE